MKPVHFNCKSAARKGGRKRKRLTPLICSPDIFGSLSIHLHYFHHISFWVFLMSDFLSPPAATCWSRHVFLRAYLRLSGLSRMAFIFCYIPGVFAFLSITMPPLLLIIPHSCLYPPLYLYLLPRLLVRTCVHHQHIPATCYLITRARPTLKTSLAEQTRVEQQSVRYATKANHTTRTIQRGECQELIQSLNRGTFYIEKWSKADKSNTTNAVKTEAKRRGNPKYLKKKIKSVNFFQRTFHAALYRTLLFLCFPLEYCRKRKGGSRREPCQHRPFFQKTRRKNKRKKTNKQIRENVQLSHHRQQIRKKEPPCLYITQQHTLVSHERDKYS